MKKWIVCFGLCLSATVAMAVDVVDTISGPKFPKYRFNGNPIFSDAEKQAILDGVAKDGDFILAPDYPSQADQDLIKQIFVLTVIDANTANKILTDKKEIEKFFFIYAESLQKIQAAESATGLDFTAQKAPYLLVLQMLKLKYVALP